MHLYRIRNSRRYAGWIVSLLVFALIVLGVWVLFSSTEQRQSGEQAKLLKDALRRATVSCYAVEGRYPPSLDYIKKNYGVVVNEDKFIVRYDVFAENIMPELIVLEVGKEGADDDYDEQ